MKSGPKNQSKQLLRLWQTSQFKTVKDLEWLPYSTIIEKAKQQLNLEKRTTINYLNLLTENKILSKQINADRTTYYKPINDIEYAKNELRVFADFCNNQDILEFLIFMGRDLVLEVAIDKAVKTKLPFSAIAEDSFKRLIEGFKGREDMYAAIKEVDEKSK